MKSSIKLLIIIIGVLCISTSVFADRKSRKLPDKAYVKSASILIDANELGAYDEAKGYLDTLFIHYGQHTEGLFVMVRLMSAYLSHDSTEFKDKSGYANTMSAYIDTLEMKCNDPNSSKRDKKKCDEFLKEAKLLAGDRLAVFYNTGLAQMKAINEIVERMESDEAALAEKDSTINIIIDSIVTNYANAIKLDKTHYLSYVNIAKSYESAKQFQPAIDWMVKAMEHVNAEERQELLLPIAYDYIQMNNYCDAIPYMEEFIDVKEDAGTMFNLAVCYWNCKMYDKAFELNKRIIAVDPYELEAYSSVSDYFIKNSRIANDSIYFYKDAENEAKVKEWTDYKNEQIDSVLFYIGKATEIAPSSTKFHEVFATYSAIRGRYDEAAKSYIKLTELNPSDPFPFIYLGECYMNMKDWPNAIIAIEKAVELDPNDRESWISLSALYREVGESAKAKEAYNKAEALK